MTRTHYAVLTASILMLTVCLMLLRRPAELPPAPVPAIAPPAAQITATPPPASETIPLDYESIRTRTAEAIPQVIRPQEPEPTSTVAQNPPVIAPEATQDAQTPQPLYYLPEGVPVYPRARDLPPEQRTPEQQAQIEQSNAALHQLEAREYQRNQFERRFFDNFERAAIQREHNKQMRRHALGGGG